MTAEDQKGVEEVLERFVRGWRDADADTLKGTWDAEYPDSCYIASEAQAAVWGYPAIAEYYEAALASFPITSMKISNVRISGIGEVAHAYCDIAIGFVVNDQEHVVEPHATFVLHKRGGEWRVLSYHESIQWELPS